MALRRIGNTLVLEGVGKYISDSDKVNKAIEKNNAALKKQTEVAAKTALSNKALEEQSRSLGKRLIDAFTAPFRMLGKIIGGIFGTATSVAKTVIFGPFKILGSLAANVLKGVIVASITSKLIGWIFEGKAPIPQGWKSKIGTSLTGLFTKAGGESGLKFWAAFQKFGAQFFQGKMSGMLSQALGLVTGGPMGAATNRIVGSVFSGFGKAKDIAGAVNDNKAWGDLFKNIGAGGGNALKNIGKAFEPAILRVKDLGAALIKNLGPSVLSAIAGGFKTLVASLGPLVPAILGVVGALVGLKLAMVGFKAFVALGQRGAAFEGVIASFDILARQAQQVPQALLQNMRKAANGTIADLDLITNANLALAGATGETAKLVGEGLPKLLEIARAQARSTGKDVNFLFNSLVEGVKKAQPELIDNTGLLVRIGEANEELAKSLGKSVEALSAQERQQAILNATLKAGESAVKQLQGAELTAAEIQQQIDTNRKNSLDTLALAIQPVYKVFLTIRRSISEVMLGIVKFIAPLVYKIGGIIAAFAQGVSDIANRITKVFRPMMKDLLYAAAIASLALDAIQWSVKAVFSVISWEITQISTVLDWFGDQLIKIFPFLKVFQEGLFIGAAKAFGSFAAGMLQAANKYIFPGIIAIATFIADFLMGESPPPMGPLSTIDKGGANVMQAWLGGIMGVSLEPVSQVAAQVTAMLGDVANYSLAQVKVRLGELDIAIQPFQDRLDLIQARLDALSKPLERARDMIAKRLDSAVELLTKGGGDAGQVRALDKQLELINQRLEMNDEELNQAQLQLELAQALQAEERAALGIRERMLGATEDIADSVAGTSEAATGGGGAGESAIAATAGLAPLLGGASATDSILGLDKIKGALGDLQNAAVGQFISEGGDKALAEAQGNIGKLKTQTARISTGSAKLASKLIGPFQGLKDTFAGIFDEVQTQFDNYFGEEGTITGVVNNMGTTFDNLFGEKGSIRSLFVGDKSVFAQISGSFQEHFGPESPLNTYFGPGGLFGAGGAIETAFGKLFGPADTEGTLLYNLTSFKASVTTLFDSIFNNADSPVQKIITSVMNVVDTVWSWFNALTNPQSPYSISEAFAALKSTIQTALVNPVVDAVESMMNSVIDSINKAIETVWDAMPGVVQAAARRAGLDLGSFQISHIDIPYPTFHEGGVVRANLLKGEGVLSIPMMKTLASLEKTMRIPSYSPPVIVSGGRGNSSVDRSLNIENIHYHEQQRSAKRTVRELRSLAARNGI